VGLLSDAGCPSVADPGAEVVAAAHQARIIVVPLVGPSSVLLALMASGMNGQGFTFHGYLPVKRDARAQALKSLEAESQRTGYAQLFIGTPYRNEGMLASIVETCKPSTRLCVAVDLTLESETVQSRTIAEWKRPEFVRYPKRPAMFVLQACGARARRPRRGLRAAELYRCAEVVGRQRRLAIARSPMPSAGSASAPTMRLVTQSCRPTNAFSLVRIPLPAAWGPCSPFARSPGSPL